MKCKTCKYSTTIISGGGNHVCCYYIVIKGHRRPCKPGNDCTEYEPKEKGDD